MSGNGFECVTFFSKEKTSKCGWNVSFAVSATSSYFKEHFEGFRLLPAVGEIDIVARCASEILGGTISVTAIKKAKFVSPVRPDEKMSLTLDFSKEGCAGFTIFDKKGEKASFGLIEYTI